MPRIVNLRPGRAVGTLPTERHIRIGRRRLKDGRPTYPERLDYMEVCLPGVDPDDAAGNRQVDDALMARLLEEQARLAPEEPTAKLRAIRVYLAPARDLDGIFGSQFRARTKDGDTVVCQGDGQTACHRHRVSDDGVVAPLPQGFKPVGAENDLGAATTVVCNGTECPWYARMDATGKQPVFPRCAAEWELRLQLAALESTFGVVRYRSKSIIGLDETQGVIDELQRLVDEEKVPTLSAVPLLLRMKRSRTAHGAAGVWTVYLGFAGPALAMIEAAQSAYESGRVLGAGARPLAQLAAHVEEPLVRATPAADLPSEPEEDIEDVEDVEEVDDAVEAPDQEPADQLPAETPAPQPAAESRTPSNGSGPSPLWQHVRGVALELEGGDMDAAKARLREALDEIRADDPEFPRPAKDGSWAADEAQAAILEETLRALATLATRAA
jgi:hypothetical protein